MTPEPDPEQPPPLPRRTVLRRMALGAAVLPLAGLVGRDALPPPTGGRPEPQRTAPSRGPRPPIVSRARWRADESLRPAPAEYTGATRAVFVHHTVHPDGYDCADVPEMLRAMYEEHVVRLGWDDIGYNFLVDACGTVYEGCAGGAERYVYGAHTRGFNRDTVGVAVLGSYGGDAAIPPRVLEAVAAVAAWKLSPDVDPLGRVRLVSEHSASRYRKGARVELDAIAGHRDASHTHCPGDALYAALPEIRRRVARLRVPR